MKVRKILYLIYSQAPIANSFLVLALFFVGFGLSIKSEGDDERFISTVAPFLMVMIFVGMSLGNGFKKLQMAYLWKTNKEYQKILNHTMIIIPLALCLIFLLIVFLSSSSNSLIALAGLVVIYSNILGHILNKPGIILYMYLPVFILIQFKEKTAIFLLAYYVIILVSYIFEYRKFMAKGGQSKRNTAPRNLLIDRFKFLQPNYLNGDVGLALSSNGLNFPTLGLFAAVLTILFNGFKLMSGGGINEFYIASNMLILNMVLVLQYKVLLSQTKKYAHVFEGKNNLGIKEKVIGAMDKKILLNNLVYISIILAVVYSLDLSINKPRLIQLLFVSVIFFFNTYLFNMALRVNSKAELIIIYTFVNGPIFFIIIGLLDKFEAMYFSWTFYLGILSFAMLIRFLVQRKFTKTLFEKLFI